MPGKKKQECQGIALARCRKWILDRPTRAAGVYPFRVIAESDSGDDVYPFSLPLGIGGS